MPNMNIGKNGIEIQILGDDQVSDDLLRISGNLDKLKKKTTETTKTTGVLGKATAGMSTQFKGLASTLAGPLLGFTALTGVVTGVANLVKSSITDWVAYNEEMRKLGAATGVATEDLSRLMQAADDMGVSMEGMKTALVYASKNGVKPTIEGIAQLSDRLLAITDTTKRSAEMQRLFGRGYAEVAGFVLKGGDAIRKTTAAIDDNLVVTKESALQAREYAVQLDTLNDTITGLKNELAIGLLPTIIDVMDEMNGAIQTVIAISKGVEELTKKTQDNTKGFARWGTAIWNVLTIQYKLGAYLRGELYEGLDWIEGKLSEATEETDNATTSTEALARAYEQSIPQIGYYATATGDANQATIDIKGNMDNVTASMKEYNTQLLFTIASQDLDAAAALELARQLGLVDERTIAITNSIPLATAMFDANRDGILSAKEAGDGYYAALSKIDSMLNQLDGRKISIDVVMRMIQTALTYAAVGAGAKGGGAGAGSGSRVPQARQYAEGTDFVIPPGYPNDSYPIGWGQSGERVIVIPKGETAKGSNYNLTIYTNAPVESMVKDFNMMRTWARV